MMATVRSRRERASGVGPRSQVMVVEDDPDICELLSLGLSTAGHDVIVTEARSVSDLVAAVREHQPNAVVLELPRPGAAHADRFEQLRDHPALSHVALVTTTSYPPGHTDVALRASDSLLAKPFSITELTERLRAGIAITGTAIR